jgi:hypothetical protein
MHISVISTSKRIKLVVGCRIILRVRWCHTVFVNVHAANEYKGADSKDHFC